MSICERIYAHTYIITLIYPCHVYAYTRVYTQTMHVSYVYMHAVTRAYTRHRAHAHARVHIT
jgi:hypothetical protein